MRKLERGSSFRSLRGSLSILFVLCTLLPSSSTQDSSSDVMATEDVLTVTVFSTLMQMDESSLESSLESTIEISTVPSTIELSSSLESTTVTTNSKTLASKLPKKGHHFHHYIMNHINIGPRAHFKDNKLDYHFNYHLNNGYNIKNVHNIIKPSPVQKLSTHDELHLSNEYDSSGEGPNNSDEHESSLEASSNHSAKVQTQDPHASSTSYNTKGNSYPAGIHAPQHAYTPQNIPFYQAQDAADNPATYEHPHVAPHHSEHGGHHFFHHIRNVINVGSKAVVSRNNNQMGFNYHLNKGRNIGSYFHIDDWGSSNGGDSGSVQQPPSEYTEETMETEETTTDSPKTEAPPLHCPGPFSEGYNEGTCLWVNDMVKLELLKAKSFCRWFGSSILQFKEWILLPNIHNLTQDYGEFWLDYPTKPKCISFNHLHEVRETDCSIPKHFICVINTYDQAYY